MLDETNRSVLEICYYILKSGITSRALRDLDGIYAYIAGQLLAPDTALAPVDRIEEQILSLENMPNRCPSGGVVFMLERDTGNCLWRNTPSFLE